MQKFALLSIWDSGNYVKIFQQIPDRWALRYIPRLALLGLNLGVAIGSRDVARKTFSYSSSDRIYGRVSTR
eukprot:1437656-Pleurochrysis_carterae.AAC.1